MRFIATAFAFFLIAFSHTGMAAPTPAAPSLSAKSYFMMDFDSGKILAEHEADKPVPPASLTKLMTSYVVFRELGLNHISLEDEVLVSKKAWRTGGSRMFIEVGKRIKLEMLLKGMIIQSGNDASVALAEHVAGSEEVFAQMMNTEARRLGMDNTNFTNSTGLPDKDQYVTARDMAILARSLIRDFPEYYRWYSQKSFTFNKIKQPNRNKLLYQDPSVDGLKTGYTKAAGYCLVTSAKRGEQRLITIVMGTKGPNTRAKESRSLLNYGFRFFETHKLYATAQELIKPRVWKGESEQVGVGVAEDIFLTIPRRSYDRLKAETRLNGTLTAPVSKGQELGRLVISLDGETLVDQPLIALQEVPEGGLFQRLKDEVMLMLE